MNLAAQTVRFHNIIVFTKETLLKPNQEITKQTQSLIDFLRKLRQFQELTNIRIWMSN